ncbi:MAG: HlyC/CorC family transporter [Clostridia bacterium]|nr:HlyC/CorC family transporter [Clostridia bacterium]MBR4972842.1 HlyC/CorC family transporter [Clostridia bacterium]
MDGDPAGSIILFVLLMFCSGYFAGTEISFASVNRIHMMSKASNGDKSAERVLKILDNFDEALSVLLIGNNVAHIGIATISTVIATKMWGVGSVTAATFVTTIIVFLFGEMLPKCFARSCNEKFAQAVSGSLLFLMKVLKPFSMSFTALSTLASKPFKKHSENQVTMTEDELTEIVENISVEDGFDEDTGELVKSALRFSNSKVGDIMVNWDDVQKISMTLKTTQILDIVKESVHSRIPVIDRKGNLKGILQIRKFLKAYTKQKNVILASIIDYPYYVDSDEPIDEALTEMSNHRRNLAIVRGNDGEIVGILTVEDILEELVGEIYDEDDRGGNNDE